MGMKTFPIRNPIRLFAVICVAATSVFVMIMSNKLVQILAGPEWCGKALQAEKISSQNFGGLTACITLLQIQLKALALNSYIFGGVIALCLLTLIVIVIAGARLDFKASATGVEANIDRGDAVPVTVTNAPTEPVPTAAVEPPTGPAMPEPK
jgi:hypothetical protein